MSLLSRDELTVRAVSVRPSKMVLLKNHLEASEGLGFLIAKRGGVALLVSPVSQADELDAFIADMDTEIGLSLGATLDHEEAEHVGL